MTGPLSRTFHPDEANQAFTTGRLLETGRYEYNPRDHHGPTLYYAAAPLQRAFGHSTTADLDGTLLRCTPLVFAVLALAFGFSAVRRLAGRVSAGLAFLLLLGTSPMFVFFATDFIQEMLLASFTLFALFAAVGYFRPGRFLKPGSWAILLGVAAGLCFATKETCVLNFAAAGLAATPFLPEIRRAVRVNDLVLAAAGFLLTAVLFYSSFGADFHGVWNAFVSAPLSYVGRAAGNADAGGADWHVHPWWQHLEWLFMGRATVTYSPSFRIAAAMPHLAPAFLVLSSLPLLLATKTGRVTSAPLRRGAAFAALYTVLLLALYSAVPYKTPWCTLQVLVGFMATAALTAALLGDLYAHRESYTKIDPDGPFASWSRRWTPALLPLALAAAIVAAERISPLALIWRDPDSKRIPYNYASASPQVKELAAAAHLALENTAETPLLAVALPPENVWPFPWYNRANEKRTGYWTSFEDLEDLAAKGVKPTAVIVPATEGHLVQPLFPHLTHTRRFETRPRVRVRLFW